MLKYFDKFEKNKLLIYYEDLINGSSVDLAFVVEVNEWRGKSTVQLNIRDIKQVVNT